MATQAELYKLRAERSQLTPNLTLTPKNAQFSYIRYQTDQQREVKIASLEQQFGQRQTPPTHISMPEKVRGEFNKVRQVSYEARVQFNQKKAIEVKM